MPFDDFILRTSPANRPSSPELLFRDWRGGARNKNGTLPVQYECTERGERTDWVKFECGEGDRGCREEFWDNRGVRMARKCPNCDPGAWGSERKRESQARLQLTGKKIRYLEVVGHEAGKGWKVKCDCGRERTIFNGTLLAAGGYKTCGKCTEEERRSPAHSMAPPASLAPLRDVVVADKIPPGAIPLMQMCNGMATHELIAHAEGGDCPLCAALARIELLEGELAEIAGMEEDNAPA